jgi:hypothetical protein
MSEEDLDDFGVAMNDAACLGVENFPPRVSISKLASRSRPTILSNPSAAATCSTLSWGPALKLIEALLPITGTWLP